MPPCIASASVTAGLKWAPEIGPSARISATRAAPVARELASSARATFPPASRSAMIPDPTTAISRNAVPNASLAARRTTARLLCRFRFYGADKGAQEFAVHLGGECADVDALPGKKFTGIFGAIDASGFDVDLRESG